MNPRLIFATVSLLFTMAASSQQTIGLFRNSPESFDGYTLFAPLSNTSTYLINNCGERVHQWNSHNNPNLSCYLLENGILLRPGHMPGPGGSNLIEMIDWNDDVIWDLSLSPTIGTQHHDIAPLPNGNILMIAKDYRSQAEVVQAGGSTTLAQIESEQIIEIKPDLVNGGGTIVWTWKVWDHLIQDSDPTKDHFGVVGDHPERIDVNFTIHNKADWLHFNGVDYNADLDQIAISVHNFSEFWIIDHSTSTAQAADTTGGKYGQGGDLLYRWGNPQTYHQGSATDEKLFLQHNAHWIPEGYPDAGKILVFNNQAGNAVGQNYSTVNIVDPPVDSAGFYHYAGGSFAPATFDWTYKAPVPTDFFSNIISGVQRLENGNTLICEGVPGRFFEIDARDSIVWEYINPVSNSGPQAQGTAITNNSSFRCTRYAADYPGLAGKDLTPMGYIESGSTFTCDLFNGISITVDTEAQFWFGPNPASEFIDISLSNDQSTFQLFRSNGTEVFPTVEKKASAERRMAVNELESGLYLLVVKTNQERRTEKVLITH